MKLSERLRPYIVHLLVNSDGREYSVRQLVDALAQDVDGDFIVTPQAVRDAIKTLPRECVRLDSATQSYRVAARPFVWSRDVYVACLTCCHARGFEPDGIGMMLEPIFPMLQYELVMRGHLVWDALKKAHRDFRGDIVGAKFAFQGHPYGWMITLRGEAA